jgi:hypothetical protein
MYFPIRNQDRTLGQPRRGVDPPRLGSDVISSKRRLPAAPTCEPSQTGSGLYASQPVPFPSTSPADQLRLPQGETRSAPATRPLVRELPNHHAAGSPLPLGASAPPADYRLRNASLPSYDRDALFFSSTAPWVNETSLREHEPAYPGLRVGTLTVQSFTATAAPSPRGSTRWYRPRACPGRTRTPCRIPGRRALRARRP